MSAGAKVRAVADFADFVAGMVCDGHDGEKLVKTIAARDAEVRAQAFEEAAVALRNSRHWHWSWGETAAGIVREYAAAQAPAQAKGGG